MSYNSSKSPKQSNKTQNSKSKSKSPNKSSPNKTRKSLSPKSPTESENRRDSALDIFYQANPNSLNAFQLFSTNSKYKKQFRKADGLDVKILTLKTKNDKLSEFVNENENKTNVLERRISEIEYRANDLEENGSPNNLSSGEEYRNLKKEQKNSIKDMKRIRNEIKVANDEIDKNEILIEKTQFLRKIWNSKKIDENTKQTYADKYNKFVDKNQRNVDKIQNEIEKNRKITFNKTYPRIESVFIENPDDVPEESVEIGRDEYLINDDAVKFWDFTHKQRLTYARNSAKWNSLNRERDEFEENIRQAL